MDYGILILCGHLLGSLLEELSIGALSTSELFYSTIGLPVITPANCKQFLSMASGTQFKLWNWLVGSSRFSLIMSSLPCLEPVLFSVDARYGWDISCPAHQAILRNIDDTCKPLVTTFELRSKFWSKVVARKPDDVEAMTAARTSEFPMLSFLSRHIIEVVKGSRHILMEQAQDSDMFKLSPVHYFVVC